MLRHSAIAMLVLALTAIADDKPPSNSGKRAYVVEKTLMLQYAGIKHPGTEQVADFDTFDEAMAFRSKQEKIDGDRYQYWVLRRPGAEKPKSLKDRRAEADHLLTRLKQAKQTYELAKRASKGDAYLEAPKRKLGDTVKEYKEQNDEAKKRVAAAKNTLTEGTDAMLANRVKEANALIDEYNKMVDDYAAVMGNDGSTPLGKESDLGQTKMDRLDEAVYAKKGKGTDDSSGPDIVGIWVDKRDNTSKEFKADGTMIESFPDSDARNEYNWKRDGNKIFYRSVAYPNGDWIEFDPKHYQKR